MSFWGGVAIGFVSFAALVVGAVITTVKIEDRRREFVRRIEKIIDTHLEYNYRCKKK